MHDLTILLKRLADSGVDFVIVGGFAAVTHGSSQVTRDIDICAVLSPENIVRIREALRDWHPKHRLTPQRISFLDHPKDDTPVSNLYLETDHGVVDILSSVLGVGDFERLKQSAELLKIDGVQYRLISLNDLIAAKEALGRDKDKLTAKELRAIAAKRSSR
jgi:predicted nucleotidyltransferase